MSLTFGFDANNSSGAQALVFTKDEEKDIVYPCLLGEHKGEAIQVDFNGLDREELQDLIGFLEMQLKKFKG